MGWYLQSQSEPPSTLRPLGKTGWEVPLFSLGGQSLLESTEEKDKRPAIELIQQFIRLGGKYIDTSPEYSPEGVERLSEKRIGKAIAGFPRDSFYLATKTEERDAEPAWRDINESIETLGTSVNCIQVHHLDNKDEVEQIFSKKGAMKALIRAKEEGLTEFLGITGHHDPNVLLSALYSFPFDTVLGAFNAADVHMEKMSFQKKLIPYCEKHNIGFIAMKTCSRGALFGPGGLNSMREALYYVWSFPISTAIVGINNLSQLRRNMDLAKKFTGASEEKISRIEEKTAAKAKDTMYFNRNGNEDDWKYYERGKQTPTFAI